MEFVLSQKYYLCFTSCVVYFVFTNWFYGVHTNFDGASMQCTVINRTTGSVEYPSAELWGYCYAMH